MTTLRSEILELPDSQEAVLAAFCERNWCDGLPIIAPTPERVEAMLEAVRGDPSESLGAMPPLWGEVTLEKLAINAVMAGCLPQYLPVIVAAVEAMLDPVFNLNAVQTTTHPVAPLLVVSGPYATQIGMHGGAGCFGPGCRANATIGRALRLILLNVGGAWPGRHDMATHGSPAKFSYAIAENETANPWEPLHVELGYGSEATSVTLFGGEGPHSSPDHGSGSSGILHTIADTAATLGSSVKWYHSQSQLLIVLGPEHAASIARDGMSKNDVKRFLFEVARLPLRTIRLGGLYVRRDWPRWMEAVSDPEARLPLVQGPEEIFIVVAGGDGRHSVVVPNCSMSRAVSRPVTRMK